MTIEEEWEEIKAAAWVCCKTYRESNPEWANTDSPLKYVDQSRALEHTYMKSHAFCSRFAPGAKRSFEIGPGAGYIMFMLQNLGVEVNGCDQPGQTLYRDMHQLLKLAPVAIWPVHRLQKIDAMHGQFDLIYGTQISWMDYWSPYDLEFFLDDCRSHLTPGGRIVLFPNPLAVPAFNAFHRRRIEIPPLGYGYVFGKELNQ